MVGDLGLDTAASAAWRWRQHTLQLFLPFAEYDMPNPTSRASDKALFAQCVNEQPAAVAWGPPMRSRRTMHRMGMDKRVDAVCVQLAYGTSLFVSSGCQCVVDKCRADMR